MPSLTAHYSYRWADEICKTLEDKYPRATAKVYEILVVNHRNMVTFLARNDPVFPKIRSMVHSVEQVMKMQDISGEYYTNERWNHFLQRKATSWHDERLLTRLKDQSNI